jgi:hypothetical protein
MRQYVAQVVSVKRAEAEASQACALAQQQALEHVRGGPEGPLS